MANPKPYHTVTKTPPSKKSKPKARRARKQRTDLYQEVTDKIIRELEAGRVPWVQPWDNASPDAAIGMPKNANTGNTYSGINILLLWASGIEQGFKAQKWVTFKQALEIGGNVRKGQRGTTVCYADTFIPKSEQERQIQTGEQAQSIGFLKRYTVFNVEQCEGLDIETDKAAEKTEADLIPAVKTIIDNMGVPFHFGGNKAFYMPSIDAITMPPMSAYYEPINFYRTAMHEISHSTGHKSRLDRKLDNARGSKGYAFEECIAEISASYICASLSIRPTVRHSDYIGSWLELLKKDKRAIFKAASQASKAADFVLAFGEGQGE